MKPDQYPFAVYTRNRPIKEGKPFIVWGISGKSVFNKWLKRYKETPVKVTICVWDCDTATYIPLD